MPLSALDKEKTYGTKLHGNKIHAVFYYNLYCMYETNVSGGLKISVLHFDVAYASPN